MRKDGGYVDGANMLMFSLIAWVRSMRHFLVQNKTSKRYLQKSYNETYKKLVDSGTS